jgi:hypothetical protein
MQRYSPQKKKDAKIFHFFSSILAIGFNMDSLYLPAAAAFPHVIIVYDN